MSRARILRAFLVMQVFVGCSLVLSRPVRAEPLSSAALVGTVSSQEEGPMEGVLVSAKREDSTVTISVVSDSKGQFSFPRTKLELGRYVLHIRAVGYDLSDPGPAEVTSEKPTQINLKLVKTKDLAAQLTNSEWLLSAPGDEQQKRYLVECSECHTVEGIFRSHYTAADFKNVIHRMSSYDPGSSPEAGPQMAVDGNREKRISPEYLSTINLSSVDHWQFPLKTLPRPTGEATKVIFTEYDLPRAESQPHDVTVDKQGVVWYADFGRQYFGRLDPKTVKVTEYPLPLLKPEFPVGFRVLWLDPLGNVWISMLYQGAIAKFDPKTEKFEMWKGPNFGDKEINESASMAQPAHLDVDGKVWVQMRVGSARVGGADMRRSVIQRFDPITGEWDRTPVDAFGHFAMDSPAASRPHGIYDTLSDSRNNAYFTDFGSEYIGRVDSRTKEVTYYQTPTLNSGPRRGHVDQQDRFWFGEDKAGKIGMLNTKTGQIQEWAVPTPFSDAYDVNADKNGEAWEGGIMSDRLARLNPKTGNIVEYLLPRWTNIRRVEVDNSTNPVTIWFGNTHKASIVKVEPLE